MQKSADFSCPLLRIGLGSGLHALQDAQDIKAARGAQLPPLQSVAQLTSASAPPQRGEVPVTAQAALSSAGAYMWLSYAAHTVQPTGLPLAALLNCSTEAQGHGTLKDGNFGSWRIAVVLCMYVLTSWRHGSTAQDSSKTRTRHMRDVF